MKNAKKFLSLTTAVVMVMSTMTAVAVMAPAPYSVASAASDAESLIFDVSEGDININANTIAYGNNGYGVSLTKSYNPASDKVTITGTTTEHIVTVAQDVSVTVILAGVNIDVSAFNNRAAFKIMDAHTVDVTVTLKEGTTNILKSGYGCAGLQKQGTAGILTIDGTGSLNATGGQFGAGIGSGSSGTCSNITINSGVVTATGNGGAGIGGGDGGKGSNITISGGIVTAIGYNGGAGIGGSRNNTGSNITINGGTITATGGNNGGAGIGGGSGGTGSNINISGGTVIAYADNNGGAGIGGGYNGTGSNITISGGVIKATSRYGAGIGHGKDGTGNFTLITNKEDGTPGDAWIEASSITNGENTTNWSGVIFQGNDGKVYGNQTLTADREIPTGKTLTNNGTLTLSGGTLTGSGTITGDGQFITTSLTSSDINTPTGPIPEGTDAITYIANNTSLKNPTYLDKEFTITGWTLQNVEASGSDYIVTYAQDGTSETVTKTVNFSASDTPIVSEGVTEANGSTTYTFKNTLTTNKTDATIPNTEFSFSIAPADASMLTEGVIVGVGTPTISNSVFTNTDTLTDSKVSKDATVDFTGITFPSAGTYRYVITQNNPTTETTATTGVIVDVNNKRYLDVYVENNDDGSLKIAYYILSTPKDDGSLEKSEGFNNEYEAYGFHLTENVTGSAGDKQKDFTFTLVFDANSIVGSKVIATKSGTNEDITVSEDKLTYIVLMKHGETVDFINVPKGAQYTVTESNNDGYAVTITAAGDTNNVIDNATYKLSETTATEGITADTEVTYTNNKESVLPTGIMLVTVIPTLVGITAIGGIGAFIVVKKKDNDEEEN